MGIVNLPRPSAARTVSGFPAIGPEVGGPLGCLSSSHTHMQPTRGACFLKPARFQPPGLRGPSSHQSRRMTVEAPTSSPCFRPAPPQSRPRSGGTLRMCKPHRPFLCPKLPKALSHLSPCEAHLVGLPVPPWLGPLCLFTSHTPLQPPPSRPTCAPEPLHLPPCWSPDGLRLPSPPCPKLCLPLALPLTTAWLVYLAGCLSSPAKCKTHRTKGIGPGMSAWSYGCCARPCLEHVVLRK